MIELVCTIVILGVLAATALPRMMDLNSSARVATLQGLVSALQSAANMGRSSCAIHSNTCDLYGDGWTFSYFTFEGKQIWTHYGWPTGWGKFGVNDANGSMVDLINMSSVFQYQAHVGGSYQSIYQYTGAPDPSHCKVIYQLGWNNDSMSVTLDGSGC